MLRIKRFTLAAIAAAMCAVLVPATAFAATWSSSDKWASWSNGGYTVSNDVWGSGAGPESIWANSYSNWGVWSQQPDTGGIKSYPHSAKNVGVQLSSLSSVSSSFNVSVPTSGVSFESAYDIWAGNNAYEIMLWMNYYGAVGPISYNYGSNGAIPVFTNVSLGGHTWNIYRGNNGGNDVFSFVRTSDTNSGTVNILSILNWINSQGWYNNPVLNQVQFGFEISRSPSGNNFNCNSYSVSYSTGSNGGSGGGGGSTGGGSYVRFQNHATGLFIDGMGRTSNGSTAGQYSSGSSENQQWQVVQNGSYVELKNRATGLFLDGMGRTSNGSAVGQYSSSGSNNQQWSEISSGGYVRFQNRATGLFIDGMGATANGSDLDQWASSSSSNQQWQVVS